MSHSGMQRAVEGKSVNHDASNSSPRTDQKWRCGLIDAWRAGDEARGPSNLGLVRRHAPEPGVYDTC